MTKLPCKTEDFLLGGLNICPCGRDNPIGSEPAVLIGTYGIEDDVGLLYTIVVDRNLHLLKIHTKYFICIH